MNKRPHLFKKTPLALGIAGLLAGSLNVQAASWMVDGWEINFDSNFSLGTSIRVEDRDFALIGKSNQPGLDWSGYNPATNPIYTSQDVWAQPGSYSTNGDLANLNYDRGSAFSTLFKGVHELNVSKGDWGLFMRGMYFYDFAMNDQDRPWANPLTGQTHDPCASSEAERELCKDIRILDAFIYTDFYVGDSPVTVRVGEQVVSWGESTFIQHGINVINPVDVTRARSPGAELKEVFIPVGTVYVDVGLTENASLSAYYQYEWEPAVLPQAGSYFAGNDFAGQGGQFNNIQLGFAANPDINMDYLLASLNGLGDALRSGADQAAIGQAYLVNATKVGIRAHGNHAMDEADQNGQYGLKFTYFAEALNQTEFSLYHINYHSKLPILSGIAANFSQQSIGADLATLASTTITKDNVADLNTFAEVRLTYPEDIKLYGFSFNTNVGETALAAEIAYRVDEPLQMDDVELLYAAFPEQLANAGIRPDLEGISQLNGYLDAPVGPGERIDGAIYSDTMQIQATVTHIFGPTLGMDNFIMLGEVGYVNIQDFPDPDLIRLNSSGNNRSPSIEPLNGNPRYGLHNALSDGAETNPFPTKDAWGYRLLAVADFNNVFSGTNLQVRGTFAHDVEGITPDPMFLFQEDRKSGNLTFTFDYLSKLSASFSYNAFWGGKGTTNALSDKDYVSFNIKYSI